MRKKKVLHKANHWKKKKKDMNDNNNNFMSKENTKPEIKMGIISSLIYSPDD